MNSCSFCFVLLFERVLDCESEFCVWYRVWRSACLALCSSELVVGKVFSNIGSGRNVDAGADRRRNVGVNVCH